MPPNKLQPIGRSGYAVSGSARGTVWASPCNVSVDGVVVLSLVLRRQIVD